MGNSWLVFWSIGLFHAISVYGAFIEMVLPRGTRGYKGGRIKKDEE